MPTTTPPQWPDARIFQTVSTGWTAAPTTIAIEVPPAPQPAPEPYAPEGQAITDVNDATIATYYRTMGITPGSFQDTLHRIDTDALGRLIQGAVKKKKTKKKPMMKNLIKRTPEPNVIDGARVFNINRNLIENVSAASRFIDNAIMPRLSKGQDVHIRLRRDTSPTKKEKLYMFFKELVDNSEISGGKIGVSGPNNFILEAIKGFFPDKLKVTLNIPSTLKSPYVKDY